MTDFEKVVKGLEHCRGIDCGGCPYNGECVDQCPIFNDAINLIQQLQEELIQLRRANQQLKEWASDFTEGEK